MKTCMDTRAERRKDAPTKGGLDSEGMREGSIHGHTVYHYSTAMLSTALPLPTALPTEP
jgi:hypothetical protein